MKAVLLAAGKGLRLQPITNKISKPMIEIAGKPFLEYIITDLVESGFGDICIVIGYLGNQIRDYFQDGKRWGARIEYVTQKEFNGTADATRYARNFVGNDKFLLYMSDTIIPHDIRTHLKNMTTDDSDVSILSGNTPPYQIGKVGNVEIDGDYVKKLSEKSSESKSSLAWAGLALFKDGLIFQIIDNLEPSPRGEYEITDAMNAVLSYDKKIRSHFCAEYIDSGTPDGLLDSVKFILSSRYDNKNSQALDKNLVSIIEPVYMGENCKMGKNCVIGPYVSIGNDVEIKDGVKIEESIVFDKSMIESGQHIKRSIISSND